MTYVQGCDYPMHERSRERVSINEEISVRKPLLLATLFLLSPTGQTMAQSADPNLSRNLAASCSACHGTNGVSLGGMPSLAGQSKVDLVRKMQDYKAGRTPSTIMQQLAKGYTDEQIDLMAGWFAVQKP